MINLNRTKNPIDREGRTALNDNWLKIEQAFRNLLEQIKFLAGGEDVEDLINRINSTINSANATGQELLALKESVEQKLVEIQTSIQNANRAADDADQMNQILNRLKSELETLQINLNAIVQAEAQRVSNENGRTDAESGRVTAETARVTAEQNRKTEFDAKMTTAEEKIIALRYLLDNLKSLDYDATAVFDFPNLIKWNGSTFIALQEVTGVVPTDDGINYRLVAQRGVDGTGAVSSVNGISPSPDGNVQINFDVINNVTSDITGQGLSAAMGKFLMSLITTLQNDKADAEFVAEEVARAVAALVNEAPETLSTINALAEALGDDPNFSTTIMQMLGEKASNAQLAQTNNNLTTLGTKVNEHLDNNAWLTATLQNGWTGAMYFALAAHSDLRIKAILGTGTVESGTVIATLPTGYRPTHTTLFLANVGGTTNQVLIALINDGTVRLYNSFEVNMPANMASAGVQFNAVVNLQQ